MSEFVVSARKYRPQKFDEVVGQQHIATTLKNALAKNQLAHAFLFCGPRGVGKTTCARILAKVLNCTNLRDGADPCNECSSCKSFNDNASFNILELDAASNNSVEHIRTLTEQVRFQPQQGEYKVFIIDEVHMLSNQAFNAFLKTLEEPPSYAIFILATTEKHKIIPTILSRCQIFDFKRIQVEEIKKQLQYIAKSEGIKTDEESLHLIAQKADGAMRDALSIYDKIASSTAEEISYKDVIENLNILDYDYFFTLTDACLNEDLSTLMLTFGKIIRLGFDPEQCLQGLAEHMRELLMCKDEATLPLLQVSDQLQERYANQANASSKRFLLNALNILNQTDINFPRSKNKNLHAEVALSKLCFLSRAFDSNQAVSEKKNLEPKDLRPQKASSDIQSVQTQVEEPSKNAEKIANQAHEKKEQSTDNKPAASLEEPIKKTKKTITSIPSFDLSSIEQSIRKEEAEKEKRRTPASLEAIEQLWQAYTNQEHSPSTKGVLKKTKLQLSTNSLSIYVPNNLAKDMVQQEAELMQKIRDTFDLENVNIEIVVDLSKFPEQDQFVPKKVLSTKEIYQDMVLKNPSFENFKALFQLAPDSA